MAYSINNLLFTHAGVSETWIDLMCDKHKVDKPKYTAADIANFVNDIWKFKPNSFSFFEGLRAESSGDNIYQSPVWIRKRSLMRDSINLKKAGIIQIIGHTPQKSIDIKGKSTGGKYYFIDTLDVGEYLVIDDFEFIKGNLWRK
jgi:hypothetical protein